MEAQTGDNTQRAYRIAVQGRLDESWSIWLSGMSVSVEWADDGSPVTILTGLARDQAALRGILNRLWDLNLTLISVNPILKDSPREEANQ